MKEDILIKKYTFINENNIELDVKFLIHSELLSDQNNFVSGMKIDNGMIQYAHDFSVATFAKSQKVLSAQINGSAQNFATGVIGGKDYIGMSKDSSISFDIGIIPSGEKKEIETTGELIEIIKAAIPAKVRATGGPPAKKTFQAIRIELNAELEVLQNSLDEMIDLLEDGGRICIITFHSLEDRIVKTIFKKNEKPCTCPSNFPVCVCGNVSKGHVASRKPILPSPEELEVNSRSKSAKLRVFERN